MAILIIELGGKLRAGVMSRRVVIGRRPQDQIRLRDKSIARVHAWITTAADGSHSIADTGTETGTWVNDRPVPGCLPLHTGDRIRIGPLHMRLEAGENLPDGVLPIDLRERPLPKPSKENGISFDCSCGAPMWTPVVLAGRTGQCRACGARVQVPALAVPASSAGRKPTKVTHCGVCHGEIQQLEQKTRCPACGAQFHLECWTENGGCSVYGCSQVGALGAQPGDQPDAEAEASNMVADEAFTDGAVQTIPWAALLLSASIVGALAGTLTFGGTSLFVLAASLVYLFRVKPQRQRKLVFLSIAVSIIGALAGCVISYYWWIGTPWHPTRR
jgi:hypothetical protein